MKRRVKIIVSGRVQGVNFRRYTQLTAEQLGVRGWVRNLPDGEVEACFEGDADAVDSLVEWCRSGPPSSRVDSLDIQEQTFTGEFPDFQIRYLH
jgi:acylphosphatase